MNVISSIRLGQYHLLCPGVWTVLRVQAFDLDTDAGNQDCVHPPSAVLYLL